MFVFEGFFHVIFYGCVGNSVCACGCCVCTACVHVCVERARVCERAYVCVWGILLIVNILKFAYLCLCICTLLCLYV